MANSERAPLHQANSEQPLWKKEHTNASASATIFLADEKGRVLLVQDIDKYGGKWGPLGGFVDVVYNEEPEIAAIREAKEELDLDVRLDDLIGVWHYYVEDDVHSVAYNDTPQPSTVDKAHMHIGYSYRGTILGGSYTMQKDEIQNWGFFTDEQFKYMIKNNMVKSPQYISVGYDLWRKGTAHPLSVIQASNGKNK